jgi:hypothetical protein
MDLRLRIAGQDRDRHRHRMRLVAARQARLRTILTLRKNEMKSAIASHHAMR